LNLVANVPDIKAQSRNIPEPPALQTTERRPVQWVVSPLVV
jgi:hypothetical protein